MPRERRAYPRRRFDETVRVSWTDAGGRFHFVNAKCVDVSQTGMRIETTLPLDSQCYVNLRMDRYRFNTSARVCHVKQRGLKYQIGLQFNGLWRWKELESILNREREPALV